MIFRKIQNTFFLILVLLVSYQLKAQDKNWSLNGYLSNMQSIMFSDIKADWTSDNLIHNRLNFKWYPVQWLTVDIEMRNRFMYGQSFQQIPNYTGYYDNDNGFVNLTTNILSEKSFLLNTTVDRAFFKINKGNWDISLGRQRINWGNNFVWNPNDIFNSYSYFDFDYVEKPGVDALRVQYYTGMASSIELAVKADKNDDITTAVLLKMNKWSYDFQFMGGVLNSSDYVFGTGWSGSINNIGFRGEASYFLPIDKDEDSKEMLVAGLSFNYIFDNSLNLQVEGLYSQDAGDRVGNLMEYYNSDLSVKTLAFSDYSVMASASFSFNPLLNGTFAAMYFPDNDGWFIGPSIEYSLTDNLSLSVFSQYFDVTLGENNTKLVLGFIRLKGNF